VDVYIVGCPPRPENLFYGLLKLQEKIDSMSLAKQPTGVRLEENMLEEFKKNVRIGKAGTPEFVQIG
jgi:NADH-quinone oxidoreductase subunit B